MASYRVLEHTADVGFEAWGATREELFSNAACALQDLMVDLTAIEPREEMLLRVEGDDAASLLVNWLSHILYLFDAEGRAFHDFKVQQLTDRVLEALAHGEAFDRERHLVKLQVKAITYHQLALEPAPEGWRARVFVDI
jgi:protein archease